MNDDFDQLEIDDMKNNRNLLQFEADMQAQDAELAKALQGLALGLSKRS